MRECQASLRAKASFPETQMALAGVALVLRNFDAGLRASREAVALDPQQVEGWVTIARILAATGDVEGARRAVGEGLAASPSSEMLARLRDEIAEMDR